jgi:hypothetical protein
VTDGLVHEKGCAYSGPLARLKNGAVICPSCFRCSSSGCSLRRVETATGYVLFVCPHETAVRVEEGS